MGNTDPEFHGTARFRIVSRVGAGAASAVYKAIDENRGSMVALRTLPPVPPGREDALKDEFRTLKNLRHPSLVTLEELAHAEGIWFYTMELVEGESMLQYVRPAPFDSGLPDRAGPQLDETRARSALSQLVRALVALHDAKRIHGNLSPESLRVTAQGRVVLLDACLLPEWLSGEEADLSVLRALPYVAPERLEGSEASSQTDWYSTGALLFEALAGRPPFSEAGGAELADAKYRVVPWLPVDAQIPADLAKLSVDLMSIDPDGRPTDEELLTRLKLRRDASARPSQTFSVVGEAPPFVGRKRELSLLAEAFERTRQGSVSTLCLYGDSGTGKRTLAQQLARRLRREYPHLVQLQGRCYRDGPVGFRGVSELVDALSRYLATQDASAVATLLPSDATLLPIVFPSMARVPLPARESGPHPQEPPAVRRMAFRALRALLRDLSQRHPLLIVLDDMQWVDSDSIELLDQLVRTPDAPHMLLLMLVSGELSDASRPLRHWLARREEQITHMRLRELSKRASLELAERLLGGGDLNDEASAAAISEYGRGHPMWIDALARHRILFEQLPPARSRLTDVLRARLEKLPRAAAHLLDLLCAAQVPLPTLVLSEAAQLDTEELAGQLGTLRVLCLARASRSGDEERVAPFHEWIARAVEEKWTESQRRKLHRAIATAMSGWSQAPSDVLAEHWLAAGEAERGGRALVEAADEARKQLAFEAAVLLYQRAIAHSAGSPEEKNAVRTQLAHAYAHAGQGQRAAQAYLEAAQSADAAMALELQRRAAHQLLRSGNIEEGLATAHRVLKTMGIRLPETTRSALLSLLWHRVQLAARGTRFKERDSSLIAPNQMMRADILGSLAAAMSMVDSVRGADAQTRYLLMTLDMGDPARIARALALEAGYQATTGGPHRDDWIRTLDRAINLAARAGDAQARGLALTVQSTATFLGGSWRDNVDVSVQAERVLSSECTDVDWEIANTRIFRAVSRFYLGELKLLSERANEQIREAGERGDHYTHTNLRIAVGYVPLLIANDPRRAASLLDESLRSWGQLSFQMQHFFYLLGRTQIDIYQRRPGAYVRTMDVWPDLVASLLLRIGLVEHTARHLRGRAALNDAQVLPEQRDALLRDAAACANALVESPLHYACGWGYALRAGISSQRGDVTGTVRHLQRAEAQFYENDMTLYAAAARLQLGQLLPEREGQPLVRRATDWFTSQGVRRPRHFADMLLPGMH